MHICWNLKELSMQKFVVQFDEILKCKQKVFRYLGTLSFRDAFWNW